MLTQVQISYTDAERILRLIGAIRADAAGGEVLQRVYYAMHPDECAAMRGTLHRLLEMCR